MDSINLETSETEKRGTSRWLVTDNGQLFENDDYQTCSVDEALTYLNSIEDEIQLDSETEGFDPHTCNPICWQLGDRAGENQFLFPYSRNNMMRLKPILEKEHITFVLANAQFDLRFLRKDGIKPKKLFDVFLAECVLTTGYTEEDERHLGLDALVQYYTGNTLNKTIRGVIHREGLSQRVIRYACEDVRYMSAVKAKQIEKLKARDLMNVMDLENKAVIAFAALCYNGVKPNVTKWTTVAQEVSKLVDSKVEDLDGLVIAHKKLDKFKPKYTQTNLFNFEQRKTSINWSSNKQKLDILQTAGLKIDSVGDRVLQKHKKAEPIVKELIEYNKAAKLESSFGMGFLKHVNVNTGRVHPQIWQIISTGRISVSEPNLNQIPSKGDVGVTIRSCFVAEEGYSIVGGDYSGMELRLIAEFSQDPVWVNAFREGKDLHSVLCALTFGIPESSVKKPFPMKPEMTYRDVQKTINFGLAYGMSEFKLADTMDITTKEAKAIIDKFFRAVPKVKQTLDMFGELGKKYGLIRTAPPFRRIRIFPKWEEYMLTKDFAGLGEIERAAKNMPMQGTNGDIIKLAACRIQDKIDNENLPAKLILSVYDELRCEVRDDIAEKFRDDMQKIMIDSAKVIIKSIPVVVDCTINKVWQK